MSFRGPKAHEDRVEKPSVGGAYVPTPLAGMYAPFETSGRRHVKERHVRHPYNLLLSLHCLLRLLQHFLTF